MQDNIVRLTRKQLYDLVWSKPMTAVAAAFRISDVGLAKRCKKHNVPFPPRGYWAKVAAGHKPKRTPLPMQNTWGTEALSINVSAEEASPQKPRASEQPATVVTRESGKPRHAVVRAIEKLLGSAYGDPPMLSLAGYRHAVLRCSNHALPRALDVLDSLGSSLEARGHAIRLSKGHRHARDAHLLEAVIGEIAIEIWLVERAKQTPHMMTPEEVKKQKQYGYSSAPAYDRAPSGELTLEADVPWRAKVRHRWADSGKRQLEEWLPGLLVGIEELATEWGHERERLRLEHQEQQRRERERANAERVAAHEKALAEDLLKMASSWARADEVRRFLSAYRARVGDHNGEGVAIWIDWASRYAARLDPLSHPERVAKAIAPPSDET